MKLLPIFAAAALLISLPALAADPHEVQSTQLTSPVTISGTAGQTYTTMISLTTTSSGVNSGTNSYQITACVKYTEDGNVDGSISFQITVDGTAIATSVVTPPGGRGFYVLRASKENIAASKVVAVQAKLTYPTDTLKFHTGSTLDVTGLAGASN